MFRWMTPAAVAALLAQAAPPPATPPAALPAAAAARLARSLDAARPHRSHVWRDTAAVRDDGTVNAYIEIARGDRRKWELDMARNARAIDRVMPRALGGYPINYGLVPQTIAYDGDPFDALVLGPAIAGGTVVAGAIVGIMHMEDETGLDAKVVLSPLDGRRRPRLAITDADRRRLEDFFNRYKQHEPGKFSRVTGWGGPEQGRAYVAQTHAFYTRAAAAPPLLLLSHRSRASFAMAFQ
jgi:inorganic pyrophosphatase